MELRTLKLLAIVLGLSFSQLSLAQPTEEEKGFVAQLEAEEEKEYQELIGQIQTMSDSEYTVFLNRRLQEAFNNKTGAMRAFVVVDVTNEMNQPEPGIFEKLLSTAPDSAEFGATKVRELLNVLTKSKAKPSLVLKDHYQSQNRMRHFQRIEGVLDESSAKLLVGQSDIVDVYIADSNKPGSDFVTTHTPTGRILPRKSQKVYDSEFLSAGFYKELMGKFEERAILTVEVGFNEPEGYEYSWQWHKKMRADIEIFLESWSDYDFYVAHKSYSYVLLQTTKEHVEAIREDERVNSIRYKGARVELLKNGI